MTHSRTATRTRTGLAARLLGLLVGTVAGVGLLAASAVAECATSTSCSFGSCSHNIQGTGVCSCSSSCGAAGVFCRCHCFSISLEPDFETSRGDLPIDRSASGVKFEIGGTISLASLAVVINDTEWGASMTSGDKSLAVLTGTYTGTLTEIVEDVGDDNAFSVSWNDTTKVVTLTAD